MINEGNIKIALFMGYEINGNWVFLPNDKFQGKMNISVLQYHSDWNKQLPVWSKLFESVMDNLVGNGKTIRFMQRYLLFEMQLTTAIRLNKPDDGQIALVHAIQWYKENEEKLLKDPHQNNIYE